MEVTKQHIRYAMVYEFHRGSTAAAASRNICEVYGEGALPEPTARRWFQKFKAGDFNLDDDPTGERGRKSEIDDERLRELVLEDPRRSVRDLAKLLNCGKSSAADHLKKIGVVYRYGRWLPHDLNEDQQLRRYEACLANLTRNNGQPFLDRIITGDEKWVLHVNMRRRKQKVLPGETPLPDTKPELHQKKVMLCIFWDQQGIIMAELLEPNSTLNGEVYRAQLRRLREILESERPELLQRGVILLVDNARPHTAKDTKATIAELGFEILSHPPYSPDLAPSDYHVFRSLQHFLEGKSFHDIEEIQEALNEFFMSKTPEFYRRGIDQLPERWEKVIACNGSYFD